MSLRVRMGVAAGVAVAIAVIAVAVSAYAGTRSQLRSQLDDSLHTLAAQAISAGGPHGPREGGDGQGPNGGPPANPSSEGTCVGDEGLGLDRLSGPAFGGAIVRMGFGQMLAPGGDARETSLTAQS